MKNQYFGDENDYRKYGLIRILSDHGKLSTGICWMLTVDDGRSDGRLTDYLRKPTKWRQHDPDLYDDLVKRVINEQLRDVLLADSPGILPGMNFHFLLLGDDLEERKLYFREAKKKLCGVDLLFFDPDNGVEIQSTPIGRKNSSKYIYWNEIQDSFRAGHSLLVYQHFPRINRDGFMKHLAGEFSSHTGANEIHVYSTSRVAFFLTPQPRHQEYFRKRMDEVQKKWGPRIYPHIFRNREKVNSIRHDEKL